MATLAQFQPSLCRWATAAAASWCWWLLQQPDSAGGSLWRGVEAAGGRLRAGDTGEKGAGGQGATLEGGGTGRGGRVRSEDLDVRARGWIPFLISRSCSFLVLRYINVLLSISFIICSRSFQVSPSRLPSRRFRTLSLSFLFIFPHRTGPGGQK